MSEFIAQRRNVLLTVVLLVAGMTHFIFPEIYLPAMPDYLPSHLELIYLTGGIEIMLGFGLLFKPTYKACSILTILYFIAILPAHIHVSWNRIEMFGISSPVLLWLRTAMQTILIFWAYKCGDFSPWSKKGER